MRVINLVMLTMNTGCTVTGFCPPPPPAYCDGTTAVTPLSECLVNGTCIVVTESTDCASLGFTCFDGLCGMHTL